MQNTTTELDDTFLPGMSPTPLVEAMKPVTLPSSISHLQHTALPPNWNMETFDAEPFLLEPSRKRADIELHDLDSFIGYVSHQVIEERTTIWAAADYAQKELSFIAVFNDHGSDAEECGWRDHIGLYKPRLSNEFKTWTSNNKNPMNQLEFALFIENNLLDINGDKGEDGLPTGAQMMQMALNLEVTQDSRIKSAVRLQSGGIRLEYVNDDDDATQKTMSVFEKFAIGIPVFWNGDCFKIEARLRYKKDGSKINFWYELIRDDKTFEHAALDMIKKIKTDTQLPFFMGTPFPGIKPTLNVSLPR